MRRWTPWLAAWRAFRDPALARWVRWLPLLALAYGISPLDLIPDLVPVVGILDDLGVGAATVALVLIAARGASLSRTGSKRSDPA